MIKWDQSIIDDIKRVSRENIQETTQHNLQQEKNKIDTEFLHD